MKVFARKEQRPLSILPPDKISRPTKPDFEVSSGALPEAFRGWLDTVPPVTAKSTPTKASANIRVPRLAVLDIMRVNHATIREGESHCIWPPFVLHKLQAAEVITEKTIKHYQLSDASLRKVG